VTASGSASGFTLLEVVIALAILSLAVVTSIELFAGGLRLLKLAGEQQDATLLADQKTREVETPTERHDTGEQGPFTWERTVRANDVPEELRISGLRPSRVYTITTRVRWGDRVVEVATLRTAAPPTPGADN
jgi:prepilin-type N-terminal cleavage/methylation domain-containing protein